MSDPVLVVPQRRASLPATGEYVGQLVVLSGTGVIYRWGSGAAWVPDGAGGGGVPDGDYGDVVVSGAGTVWTVEAALKRRVVGATFDGGGSPPTVGSIGYAVVPFSGTIDQWTILADASGSCVVDVWKAAGTIPTNADTIAGTEKPTLAAAQIASDVSLSTWTTAVAAGNVFGFELESVSGCTRITVEVRITQSA